MTDGRLKSFVERYERLAEERKAISSDMADVLGETEGVGYDKAALRRLIAWRALSAADQQEREITDETYRAALEGREMPIVERAEPRDPLLGRAIVLYRNGSTVREVQAALKAEGNKISVGTAQKLRRRAMVFLDAEKRAALAAIRPSASVHVHPVLNVNKVTGDIIHETPGATETPGAASTGMAACHPPSLGSPPPELEDGDLPAAADCRVSPEPAEQSVNAAPSSGRVSPATLYGEGSEVGTIPSMQPVIIPDDVAVERMEEAGERFRSLRLAKSTPVSVLEEDRLQ